MDYRREIDGLRAVAVLPVVLFHAGWSAVPGGFVGVDVFFVISGYLITALLLDDMEAGRYSLAAFYERRARRILPALFVVLFACLPPALVLMHPGQIEDFSASLAAVVLFVSNLWFLSQTGYFAPDAELQPLLHTWSLAVEEQFYLVFPPLLALLWRGGRRRVAVVLALVALASLAFAEWGRAENAARNFFFTGGRVWELLAGSLAALWLRGRSPAGHEAGAALGLALILTAVAGFGPETAFPSVWTLVPVAGTLLVILCAGPATLTRRLLAHPLPVGIGLVSYSAYLWHQPLFAFARIGWAGEPPLAAMAGAAVLTFALAGLTWRYVEQPFRRRPLPRLPERRRLFAIAAAVGGVVLALGLAGRQSDGFEAAWRAAFPDRAAILDTIRRAADEALPQDDGACRFNAETLDAARLLACRDRHGPGLLVLGDSHAIDLFGIAQESTDRPFVAGVTKPTCRPWTDDRDCPYADVAAFLAEHPGSFDLVLFEISGAYLFALPPGARNVQVAVERLPIHVPAPDLTPADREIAAAVAAVRALSALAPVVWLGPRIEPQVPLDRLLARGCAQGLALRPNTAEPYQALDLLLAAEAERAGVAYLSQNRLFGLTFPRDFGTCDGLLWSDGDHFSALGERTMAARADLIGAARAAQASR